MKDIHFLTPFSMYLLFFRILPHVLYTLYLTVPPTTVCVSGETTLLRINMRTVHQRSLLYFVLTKYEISTNSIRNVQEWALFINFLPHLFTTAPKRLTWELMNISNVCDHCLLTCFLVEMYLRSSHYLARLYTTSEQPFGCYV